MKTRRHTKILDLIKQFDVDTQEDLLNRLKESGFDVTQATVSRDIKELRLVKVLSSKGNYRYATGSDNSRDISSKLIAFFADSVISVEAAQNLVVIKCITGMAQAVCAAMDATSIQGIIGTLAGEDTIMAICKSSEIAFEKQEELKKLINTGA